MKSLSEICELVKKEYVEGKDIDQPYSGMCTVVLRLRAEGKLSLEDKERFTLEYQKFIKNRRVFYDYFGNKTHNKSQFAWNPKNRPARNKWLDQRI